MKFDDTPEQDYEQPPVKTHLARLIGIYDIGKQPNEKGFKDDKGNVKGPEYKMIWQWELLGKEKKEDGSNFVQSDFIPAKLHVKSKLSRYMAALGKKLEKENDDYYKWPNNYSLSVLLGEAAMVEIIHTDSGKSKIANVMAVIDGLSVPEYTKELSYLDLDSDDWESQFSKAPDWIKEICEKSIGWADRL